ncbi:hypothetical protein LZ31DRAFT_547342 [Colletotrichum somersetense]|nr:hypothetical protein LZ31DRAFT_547342 [Colletotrichum somersetense]
MPRLGPSMGANWWQILGFCGNEGALSQISPFGHTARRWYGWADPLLPLPLPTKKVETRMVVGRDERKPMGRTEEGITNPGGWVHIKLSTEYGSTEAAATLYRRSAWRIRFFWSVFLPTYLLHVAYRLCTMYMWRWAHAQYTVVSYMHVRIYSKWSRCNSSILWPWEYTILVDSNMCTIYICTDTLRTISYLRRGVQISSYPTTPTPHTPSLLFPASHKG